MVKKLVFLFLILALVLPLDASALTYAEIVLGQTGGKVLGSTQGLDFTLNQNGLSTLSYNGQSFFWLPDMNGNASFITPAGASAGTKYLDVSSAVKTTGTNYVQHVYNNGTTNKFTIKTTYNALNSQTLEIIMDVTNNDPTNIMRRFNMEPITLKLPAAANQYNGIPISTGAHSGYGPVGFLSGTWGSVAFWQGDYSGYAGISANYGSAGQTDFKVGFNNFYINQPGVSFEDQITPGATKQYKMYVRFGTSTDTDDSLAPEGYSLMRQAWPYNVTWANRGPVARWFIATGGSSSATNPRGYLSNSSLDVSNQANFTSSVLSQTDSIIARMNGMNPKPQGILIWDLEGEEFGQVFTYVGNPNKLHDLAPEMDAVADQMFAKFVAAGYTPGITLRPMTFLTGTTLPATCYYDSSNYQLSDIFIKTDATYPYRGYQCSATNTWTLSSARKPNWQTISNDDNIILQNLAAKVQYAKNRWGVKMFYVDSSVYSGGGPVDFTIFRLLQQQFPDVIFFPENDNNAYFNTSAPYNQVNMGFYEATSVAQKIWPQAFSFIESHSININDPTNYAKVVNSIYKGNIWTVDGWYSNTYDNSILQAYRDAAAMSPTPTPTPTAITITSGPSSSGVTTSSATISWSTSISGNELVDYGTTTNYGTTANGATSGTSHTVVLSSLTAGTAYHFRVKSTDANGNTATSGDFTFSTSAAPVDTTPPVVSSVSSSSVTASGATITWSTNESSDTQVEYGTTASYGFTTTLNSSLVTSHSVTLSGLSPATLYHYRVKSKDAAGNLTNSSDQTFTTLSPAVPVISNLVGSNITTSSAVISWNTSSLTNGQVDYGTTVSYGLQSALVDNTTKTTSHSITLSGLNSSTLYHFRVRSIDAYSQQAQTTDFTFMTLAPVDTTPPVVSSVSSSSVTASGATITWSTNESSDTQVEYGTTASYGFTTTLNSSLVTSHSVTLSGLSPATLYHYRVKSKDAAGNLTNSSDQTFTTSLSLDVTMPTVSISSPSDGGTISGSAVTISANASDPVVTGAVNSGVANVVFKIDGTIISTDSNAPYSVVFDSTSVSNGSHTITALATDNAGNISLISSVSVVASNSAPAPQLPTLSVSLQVSPTTGVAPVSTIDVTAVVSGTASDVINYYFYCNRSDTTTSTSTVATAVIQNDSSSQKSQTINCNYQVAGTYTVKVIVERQGLVSEGRASVVVTDPVVPTPTPTPSPTPSPTPTTNQTPTTVVFIPVIPTTQTSNSTPLRLINLNGTLYLVQNGVRKGITNPGLLFSLGFAFSDAVDGSTEDEALPTDSLLLPGNGSLVKSKEDPTVYLISTQKRYAFTSARVFLALGFKFETVLVVTDPELQLLPKSAELDNEVASHLPGTDINRNGTVYWIGDDNKLHGYPSLDVYNTWHIDNDFSRVVPANSADNALEVSENVNPR